MAQQFLVALLSGFHTVFAIVDISAIVVLWCHFCGVFIILRRNSPYKDSLLFLAFPFSVWAFLPAIFGCGHILLGNSASSFSPFWCVIHFFSCFCYIRLYTTLSGSNFLVWSCFLHLTLCSFFLVCLHFLFDQPEWVFASFFCVSSSSWTTSSLVQYAFSF